MPRRVVFSKTQRHLSTKRRPWAIMLSSHIVRGDSGRIKQTFYVVGMGNLPDSDEFAGYYYLTNPTGYGLQAFRTNDGAEAYIERLRNNPKSRIAHLASSGSNDDVLEGALSRGEFRLRRLSREELTKLTVQIKVDYLWWKS
jgi:hypothetical protein